MTARLEGEAGPGAGHGAPDLARISTGNPHLDAILCGGFPRNSINILMGEPGSGKTILAERLIFANAGDRPILYLTTLSEPLEKVVRYLQQFHFYDEELLTSGAIVYDSLGAELEKDGLAAVVPKVKEAIQTLSPQIIVIDSFKAIHDLSTSVPEMRRMLYEMAGMITAYDTTVFLVGEYGEGQIATYPEFAVADGMVELARQKQGTRDERYLRVLKLRGSDYLEGLHAFRITSDGLEVFPRLVSPASPPAYAADECRLSTGVKGLDKMLRGGLWLGSATLLEGPTGGGKTTLALQFVLEGLERGEPGLYVNFQENPTQFARQIQSCGCDLDDARRKGLHLLYVSPVELQIDSIVVEIFRLLHQKEIRRVVVDAVGDLVNAASDPKRLFNYLYALVQHFTVQRATSMLTMETDALHTLDGQISALSDTIIRLSVETGERTRRMVRIVKARGTDHDLEAREMKITGQGIRIR